MRPMRRCQNNAASTPGTSAQMQQAYRDVERGLVDTDAGREAHNVGNPTRPADPAQPGTPTPAQPSDPARPGTPGPVEPDHR